MRGSAIRVELIERGTNYAHPLSSLSHERAAQRVSKSFRNKRGDAPREIIFRFVCLSDRDMKLRKSADQIIMFGMRLDKCTSAEHQRVELG